MYFTAPLLRAQDSLMLQKVDTVDVFAAKSEQEIPVSYSAGEAVRSTPGIFLRSASIGGIQLVSAQGLNPQHIQILWNGIPVNSGMLGLSDLSLFTVGYKQEVAYTATQQEKTTGGIAGVVDVNALPLTGNGYQLILRQSVGSFGQSLTALDHSGKHKSHRWQISFSGERAQNDFKFVDYTILPNVEKRQQSGQFRKLNIYPRWEMKFKNGALLQWMNETVFNERHIPATLVSPTVTGLQNDKVTRNLLRWNYSKTMFQHEISAVYVFNYWYFKDELLQRAEENREQLGFLRYNGTVNLRPKWKLFYGSDVKYTQVKTPNYKKGVDEIGWDAHTGVEWQPSLYFKASALAKVSYRSNLPWNAPFNVEISGRVGKQRRLKLWWRGGFDARYPTLNDRFWLPGGNPDLQAEKSKGTGTGLQFSIDLSSHLIWKNKAEFFLTHINNMILWTPTNKFYWMPMNIGKILSYGLVYEQELAWCKGFHNFKIDYSYSFNRSGTTQSPIPNDKTLKKQLPYFPIHSFKMNGFYNWKSWKIATDVQAYSQRFVTRDEGQSIDTYGIWNFSLSYKHSFKSIELEGRAALNNLLNHYYEEVIYRPMPGRNFLFTFIFTWNHEKH
jgi:iron complex outermembrane receptor protein